jgi:hypothetical protein
VRWYQRLSHVETTLLPERHYQVVSIDQVQY